MLAVAATDWHLPWALPSTSRRIKSRAAAAAGPQGLGEKLAGKFFREYIFRSQVYKPDSYLLISRNALQSFMVMTTPRD